MSKKPTQQEEWGNIELPGLSDEKLYNTNWIRKASHIEHSKRVTEWHKDKEFRSKWEKGVQDTLKNPEYRKKFERGEAEKRNDPKYWEAYYAGIKRREKDKSYHKSRIEKSTAVIARRVQTPLGVFDTITLAAQAHSIGNETMRYRLKSSNFPDYIYLDNNLRPKTK